jgi:uncharacterized membrane protein YjfL (UPF0719 family)
MTQRNSNPTIAPKAQSTKTWIKRGNMIVTMTCGGAFLGVLLAQIPGAIIGGILACLLGWFTHQLKTAQG